MNTALLTVPVPVGAVSASLRAIADVIDAEFAGVEVTADGGVDATPTPHNGDLRPWTGSDDELDAALSLWARFNDASRAVFNRLMESDGSPVTRHELAHILNQDDPKGYVIAGVFGWPGRYAAAEGFQRPFDADTIDGVGVYSMRPEVARLFARARDEYDAQN